MEIVKNTPSAIVVSSQWRHFGGINLYLGRADHVGTDEDGSGVIEAHILDANDNRGLWIELNTNRKWPDRPLQNLLIPWQYVLAVVLEPGLEPSESPVGFPKMLAAAPASPEEPESASQGKTHLSQP